MKKKQYPRIIRWADGRCVVVEGLHLLAAARMNNHRGNGESKYFK